MRIVIIGPKGSGKTTIGSNLAKKLKLNFFDTDTLIEEYYLKNYNKKISFREIFKEVGEEKFREIEQKSIEEMANLSWCIISTGGSSFLNPQTRRILRADSIIIFVYAQKDSLWDRVSKDGIPAYLLKEENPKSAFFQKVDFVTEVVKPYADILSDTTGKSIDEITDDIEKQLEIEFMLRMYSPSTIGEVIRVTTFGESHGKALGVVIDGLKSGIEINEADIQKELDRRKPGQSSVTTSRGEDDKIKILSGVFEGKTTGCPIAMIVENKDMDSSKYDNLKEIFRPGHADFTFFKKFGFRDHRGGGRSSGRETLSRVAAGGIAKKLLEEKGIKIIAYTLSIGDIKIEKIDYDIIEKNPIRTCDIDAAKKMEELIVDLKKKGESIGGMVQLEIKGLPAGIGDPVFAKLDARLGGALLSIGSVKGVEFGLGFEFAKLVGSQSNDFMKDKKFSTNNAGGILGGISSGDDIIIRLVVKPTPSVSLEQDTITKDGQNTKIVIHGRHDPCIIPRIIPVVESMASLVLLDAIAIQEKLL